MQISHSLLEHGDFLISESVSFGDDRDKVDFRVKSSHNFDIKRLQGVTCRLDEINASMNTIVNNVHAIHLVLGLEVCIKSLFDVLNDRPPGVIVVDKVAKARCIDNSQPQSNTVLFNVGTDGLYRYSLWDDVKTGAFSFTWRI